MGVSAEVVNTVSKEERRKIKPTYALGWWLSTRAVVGGGRRRCGCKKKQWRLFLFIYADEVVDARRAARGWVGWVRVDGPAHRWACACGLAYSRMGVWDGRMRA